MLASAGASEWLLIPIGMLIGYFIVLAEPAVMVLTHQVEEITSGTITAKAMRLSLSIGVAISIGLAMFRVMTGISIFYLLIPGYLAAIGAVCGHLWPVWFGFKGGKGVAVAAGAILASQPVVVAGLVVVFFTLAFATRIVSLASITVAVLYPVFTALWCWYRGGVIWFPTLCAAIMGVLVIWMHRANIRRLCNGTEYKFGQKKP